jgi:hypothetical protein
MKARNDGPLLSIAEEMRRLRWRDGRLVLEEVQVGDPTKVPPGKEEEEPKKPKEDDEEEEDGEEAAS